MNDKISVFKGILPDPITATTWQEALENIRSEKYRDAVEKARQIKDAVEYRKYKTKLPAVTFCGYFEKKRKAESVTQATGFLIPDLDHLQNVEEVFNLLIQDSHVWFVFRSPSGRGLKCGIRAENIFTDDDIKKLYASVEYYFKDVYDIKIDPACKDISRLTFVSYDPALWVNPSPEFFDIEFWTPKKSEKLPYRPEATGNGWKEKYGLKVLESCCNEIQSSPPGQQHHIRLKRARLIGGFIPEFLQEQEVLSALEQAVGASGAKNIQAAMKTIRDGIEYGKKQPIKVDAKPVNKSYNKDIEYYCDVDEIFKNTIASIPKEKDEKKINHAHNITNDAIERGQLIRGCCQLCGSTEQTDAHHNDYNKPLDVVWLCRSCHSRLHKSLPCRETPYNRNERNERNERNAISSAVMSKNEQEMSRNEQDFDSKKPQNLAGHILEWITNSSGSFTTEQLDREFCLTTRKEKNARAQCLYIYTERKLINKDKRIKGKYHIINKDFEKINILEIKENPFEIILPFDLHKFVSIPKKAIIVIAGSSNAGKTALILNTLKLNLSQKYDKYYLMSEMGAGEYVDRLRCFTDTRLEDWQNIIAAERSFDFNGVIQHHNQNGLTCVDFLEEIQGDFTMMGSQIRDIYDALNEGVALIAIQKKTTEDYARGGQATAEKSRLYMTVDLITVLDHSIICALKLIKVKRYINKNLQLHEIHFKIHHGSQIEPITDWMRSSDVDRQACKRRYEAEHSEITTNKRYDDKEYAYKFKTVEGDVVGVFQGQVDTWATKFEPLNVEFQLEKMSESSFERSWLKKKTWFFQVPNQLEKLKAQLHGDDSIHRRDIDG